MGIVVFVNFDFNLICHLEGDFVGILEFLDSGRNNWTLDSGRWIMDSWTLGRWTLEVEFWTLDSGHWTLDAGLWTQFLILID